MGLGCKIIDLVGHHLADDMNETGGIGQITMVKNKITFARMRVLEMVNSISIEKRRPSFYSVYFVTLFEKKLSQIRSILPSYSGN